MLIVTTDCVPGHVIRTLVGIIDTQVMSSSLSHSGESLGDLRREAWRRLGDYASSLGANAIVGFRFESFMSGPFAVGATAYGTAVVVDAVDN